MMGSFEKDEINIKEFFNPKARYLNRCNDITALVVYSKKKRKYA